MATDTDQTYCDWSRSEISADRSNSQEASISEMLDHGSISFGRFAVEPLAWEKWSVFSHNRCQEELDRFKAPGLVAQKKAYFEEYYKKIRALKAIQAEQQGVDGSDPCQESSFSSQTYEDEQTTAQLENSKAIQAEQQGAHGSDPCQESSFSSQTYEDQRTTAQLENSIDVNISKKENSNDVPRTQFLETESTSYLDSSGRSSKDESKDCIEQQINYPNDDDGKANMRNELKVSMSTGEPDSSTRDTTTESMAPSNMCWEVARQDALVSNKVELIVNKQEDDVPVQKAKEVAASARSKGKLDFKTKASAVKPSERTKNPLRKAIAGKAENGIGLIKAPTDRIASNIKSNSVSSHRPLTEVRPNVTVSRPSSLARDKRVSSSSTIRGSVVKGQFNSKDSANRLPSRLPVHAQSLSCVQNTSKERTVKDGVRSTMVENRRAREEVGKSSELGSRRMIAKGRDYKEHRPQAMSSNHPTQNNSNNNNEIEFGPRNNVRRGRQKEISISHSVQGNEEMHMRGFGRGLKSASSMLSSTHEAQNAKVEHGTGAICKSDTRSAGTKARDANLEMNCERKEKIWGEYDSCMFSDGLMQKVLAFPSQKAGTWLAPSTNLCSQKQK